MRVSLRYGVKTMKIGLCEGRHQMPKDVFNYVFPREIDMFDMRYMRECIEKKIKKTEYMVELYVTGLTVAVVEVIKYCNEFNIPLTLMHFNNRTGKYVRQSTID